VNLWSPTTTSIEARNVSSRLWRTRQCSADRPTLGTSRMMSTWRCRVWTGHAISELAYRQCNCTVQRVTCWRVFSKSSEPLSYELVVDHPVLSCSSPTFASPLQASTELLLRWHAAGSGGGVGNGSDRQTAATLATPTFASRTVYWYIAIKNKNRTTNWTRIHGNQTCCIFSWTGAVVRGLSLPAHQRSRCGRLLTVAFIVGQCQQRGWTSYMSSIAISWHIDSWRRPTIQ